MRRGPSEKARQALGAEIRELRRSRGIPQEQLAKAIGKSGPWQSRLEGGHLWPGESALALLEHHFGLPNGKLMDRALALAEDEAGEAGRLIVERIKQAFQTREGEHEGPRARPLPSRFHAIPSGVFSQEANPPWVAEMMISLLHEAAAQKHVPLEPILICRYSEEDILRLAPHVYADWEGALRAVLQRGWNVEHRRSERAYRYEMQRQADIHLAGGPTSLLSRLGFAGEYRPGLIPGSSDMAPRLNILDVPDHGTMLFTPDGLGCFIPRGEHFLPLRNILRKEALGLGSPAVPLVELIRPRRPLQWDPEVQAMLSRVEAMEGDQIFVKLGLNAVLEPPEVRSALFDRMAKQGLIGEAEATILKMEHRHRRRLFLRSLETYRCVNVCSLEALRSLVEFGKFRPSSTEEALEWTPDECGNILEAVATLVEGCTNFELALVDSLPLDVRVLAKDSSRPVVCIEVARNDDDPQWATIWEPMFCRSLITYLDHWHSRHWDNDREKVGAHLRALAEEARNRDQT